MARHPGAVRVKLTKRDREILLRAARRLWKSRCRFAYATDRSGEALPWWSVDAIQWCAMGAIRKEISLEPSDAEDVLYEAELSSFRIEGLIGLSIAELNDTRGPRAAARFLREVARG